MKYPADWNTKLTDLLETDIFAEPKELEWARAYETDQLRKSGIRFPKDGDVYEAREDIEIAFLVHWKAPLTTGGKFVLLAGSRIKIHSSGPNSEPISVPAEALNRDELELQIVLESDRNNPKYGGYTLHVRTEVLASMFELIPPNNQIN